MKLETVSHEEMQRWSDCNHRWFLQDGLGLVPAYQPDVLCRDTIWQAVISNLHTDGVAAAHERLNAALTPVADADQVASVAAEIRCMLARYIDQWSPDPFDEYTVLLADRYLTARLRTEFGTKSTRTGFAGTVAKLVQVDGELWLLQRAATGSDLDAWSRSKARQAQAASSAWLVQHAINYQVAGVVYDLASTKPLKKASEFAVLKSGKRLAKTTGTAAAVGNATAAEFLEALRINGFSMADAETAKPSFDALGCAPQGAGVKGAEWYAEALLDLEYRDASDFWFKRHWHGIDQSEIARTGAEMYLVCTQIRRAKDSTATARDHVRKHAADPASFGHAVASVVMRAGHQYPRNQSQCWRHGRCPCLDLCANQSASAAGEFSPVVVADKATEA